MGLTTHVVRGARSERLMLLVHGYGADERDLAALVPHLDPSGCFLVVLPRGPYAAGPGYSWFHLEGPATVVAGTLRSSVDAVELVLDESVERYGLPRESAVFGGFSQGGALALALAFGASGKPRPAGVLGMSGFLPPEELVTYDWSGPLPPVLLQHGTEDPLIRIDRARDSARALASHGVPVTWREYRMGHHATLDSVGDAAAWLDQVAAGERPSEPIGEPAPPADDGPVRTVTAATWDAEVMRSDKPVIVDFWAPWCQPCRQVAPIVEQIATMRPNYKVVKVNIDENPDLAQTYQVQSIPLVALFRNGHMERKSLGAKPRPQLEAELGMLVIP